MNWFYRNIKMSLIFFASGISTTVFADRLIMDDGSILVGKAVQQENNILQFKTSYAGVIRVKWEQVRKLETDQPMTIMLSNDELIHSKVIKKDNGNTDINAGNDEFLAMKTQQVAFINPEPWRLNQGYKISGRANLSFKSQHGNTMKDEFEIDGEIIFRSLQDRYFIDGQLENDTTGDDKTADNWRVSGKYDYFVTKKRYYGLDLSFERDRFTDLDLRTVLGPHVGHQFYESKEINLGADVGLVKVYEDHIDDDDSDYLALNWDIKYDQYFFAKLTQFYHKQKGLWDWEKTDKVTLNSWTGFRFPLQSGLVASAEVEWEYDSKPAEKIHKSDTTYRLKLGYQW